MSSRCVVNPDPNIPATHLTDGRHCVVLFFDASNPSDTVVLAVYG